MAGNEIVVLGYPPLHVPGVVLRILIDLEALRGTFARGASPGANAKAGALNMLPDAAARDGPAALHSMDVVAVPAPGKDLGEVAVPAFKHADGLVSPQKALQANQRATVSKRSP